MSTQTQQPKRLLIRWTTLKGLTAIILFLIIAALIEYIIVLFALDLGTQDKTLLQWSFQFPGTSWLVTIMISPLFHLVPITIIIALTFCWTYLTRYMAVRPQEIRKGTVGSASKPQKKSRLSRFSGKIKSGLLKAKGIGYLWKRIHFARATLKSGLTVLIVFAVFIVIASLLAYPQMIYGIISNTYQTDPSFLSFVKGVTEALAPLSAIGSAIRSVALFLAPGFRDFVLALGNIIQPLASLDNDGKYLAFQNIATWSLAFAVIFYVEYKKVYRYKKAKRG